MKKMITLGLIICTSLTSSTTFSMCGRIVQKNIIKHSLQQKRYFGNTEINPAQLFAAVTQHNILLKEQTNLLREINKSLKQLNQNQAEAPNVQPDEHINNDNNTFQSKYHEELDAYHSSKLSE